MPTLIHLRERCIGCNACVELDPQHWEINPLDGKSILKKGIQKGETTILSISQIELEVSLRTVRDCPMRIIKVHK
ncbi:ferredoxin [Candidatus Woesearchaeota archaeon]|nr:ferredoxin [Candidatus Woesearchaeota archaeon]